MADGISAETNHGRIASRQCYVLDSAKFDGDFKRWKDLQCIVMVENCRLVKGETIELEYRYYISSKALTAEEAAVAVREHWGIE